MVRRIGLEVGMAALAAATALPAMAMVPPIYQRMDELRTVLDLPALATRLGIPIDRIEQVGPLLYRVTAGRCHVDVRLVEVPGGPGEGLTPPRLAARAGPRTCDRP